jgi:alpha-beta hydrolase superfamily lysophospholipase
MLATALPPIALASRYPNPRRDSVGDLAVPEPMESRCVGCVRQMTERDTEQPVPREIEFAGSDGARLAGTLTLPPGMAQFPVVVAVHAAGGGTRDAPLHRHLASFLPSLGVAAFIYDRRGEGASGGRHGAPLVVLAGDVRAAVSVIARQPGVRSGRLGLWGHSQGGWIAPMAAAGNDMVAFLIVVAGSGVGPHEQMTFATANLMREAGYGEEEVARATRLRNRLREMGRDRGSLSQARLLLREARAEPWYDLTYLPDPDSAADASVLADAASFEVDLDISPTLSELEIPVLLVYGETDRWVPIDSSIEVWRTALDRRDAQLSVCRLPGSAHFPTLAADPADLDEAGPVSPAYERALAAWLRIVASPR